MSKKKIDPASPWNPSACKRLERLGEAVSVVLSNIEEETRHRKSLEDNISKLNNEIAAGSAKDQDKKKAEVVALKAEHFDCVAEISRCRADRSSYLDEILRAIKGARQGDLFDANAPLISESAAADPGEDEDSEGEDEESSPGLTIDARPVGRPDVAAPAAAGLKLKFPGRYRLVPIGIRGKSPSEVTAGDRDALEAAITRAVGSEKYTFDAGSGAVHRDGRQLMSVYCVGESSIAPPEVNGVAQAEPSGPPIAAPAKKGGRKKSAA